MGTAFCFKKENQIIVANNKDTFIQTGMVFTNHRDLKKTALLVPPEIPFEWVSKYGSISFSQCGKEFPLCGINEEGLVVEQMALPETEYPLQDNHKALRELQWIQLILDTCKTAEEAAEVSRKIRISQAIWPIHLLVCDAYGDYRIFEFLNGELQIFGTSGDRVPVLTNSRYLDSIDYLKGKKIVSEIKETDPFEESFRLDSLNRFVKTCMLSSNVNEYLSSPTTIGFDILSQVARPNTLWSFVYHVSNPTLYIKDYLNKSKISISLLDLDFSPDSPRKVMEISSKRDILCEVDFEDYTFDKNRNLVESFYHNKQVIGTIGYHIPDETLMFFSLYPEKLSKLNQ